MLENSEFLSYDENNKENSRPEFSHNTKNNSFIKQEKTICPNNVEKRLMIEKMLDDYKLTKKTKEKPDIISSNPISQIKTNDIQREYHSQNAKTSHSANSNQNLFISVQENEEENQIKHLRLNTNEERINFIKNRMAEISTIIAKPNKNEVMAEINTIKPNKNEGIRLENIKKSKFQKTEEEPPNLFNQFKIPPKAEINLNNDNNSNNNFSNDNFSIKPKIVHLKLPIEQYLNNTNEKTEIIQPKLNFFSTHSESKEQIINPKEGQIFFKFHYIKFNCKATKINIEKDKIALTKPEISSYNKELIKRAKEIIKNKSDIKLIDNQIKQEEFEKQKELFSLQSKLTSKIIENSKIAASANLPSNLPKNQTSLELKPQNTTKSNNQNKPKSEKPIILKENPSFKKIPTKPIKPTFESLKNSILLRSSKIFINENNRCLIIDAQKFIENITQNSTSTFQKIKDSSSVFNNTINPNNIKSSAFFQANGSLAYFNPSKFEKMEKILTESTTQDIEKPNLLSYSSVVERNEKWLQEKNKKQASLKKEKEEEEIKNCSFNPNSFTKGFRSASNSRISTLIRNSELSVFSTQRSFSSNQKNNNNNNNTRSIIDSKYGDFQQKKVFSNSKWYHHESYLKEFERKKEISNKKLCNSRNEKLN